MQAGLAAQAHHALEHLQRVLRRAPPRGAPRPLGSSGLRLHLGRVVSRRRRPEGDPGRELLDRFGLRYSTPWRARVAGAAAGGRVPGGGCMVVGARACGTPRLNSSKSAWWRTRPWWHSPAPVCRHVAGARWHTGAAAVPDVTKPACEMPKRDVRLCSLLCDWTARTNSHGTVGMTGLRPTRAAARTRLCSVMWNRLKARRCCARRGARLRSSNSSDGTMAASMPPRCGLRCAGALSTSVASEATSAGGSARARILLGAAGSKGRPAWPGAAKPASWARPCARTTASLWHLRHWASPHECGGQPQALRCGLMSRWWQDLPRPRRHFDMLGDRSE